jgi:uncharacterized protein (DUF433 family)
VDDEQDVVNEAQHNTDDLARGVYLIPDVARLTELNAPRVRRWVEGYKYKGRAGDERRSSPLFHRERSSTERIFTFNRDGHEHLLDRKRRQFVNVTIFNPLIKKLDYDRMSREAMRWWPMGKDTPRVVDPKHAFGAPRVVSAAVTTATPFASFRANKNAERVADWFAVTPEEVRAAVRFEQSRIRGAKAA